MQDWKAVTLLCGKIYVQLIDGAIVWKLKACQITSINKEQQNRPPGLLLIYVISNKLLNITGQ